MYLFIHLFNYLFILFQLYKNYKFIIKNYMIKGKKNSFFGLASFLSLPPVSLSPKTRQTLHHRSASDQAIPATSSDGKGTTALLSPQSVHLRPGTTSDGAGIARNQLRNARLARVFGLRSGSFAAAPALLKLGLTGWHSQLLIPRPIGANIVLFQLAPDRAVAGLRPSPTSHGRTANHLGYLL